MKYILTEEELITLTEKSHSHKIDCRHINSITNFLKSKQPVELIESGLVQGDFGYDLFDKYSGKNIKIYVQQVQDVIVTEDDGEY